MQYGQVEQGGKQDVCLFWASEMRQTSQRTSSWVRPVVLSEAGEAGESWYGAGLSQRTGNWDIPCSSDSWWESCSSFPLSIQNWAESKLATKHEDWKWLWSPMSKSLRAHVSWSSGHRWEVTQLNHLKPTWTLETTVFKTKE